MTLIILWCFILASAKISQAYDSQLHLYSIYPRLDLTCLNSSFSFEFKQISSSSSSLSSNLSQLLIYQYQINSNLQKYFLLKLNSNNKKLIFSDHWNLNKQIPIEIDTNKWYRFIYKRKYPIGTSEINIYKINNADNNELIYKDELTTDLSEFGHSNEYTHLFVGNAANVDSLIDDYDKIQAFNGKIRNLIYSHDLNLMNKIKSSDCSLCDQLPLRQNALFNIQKDALFGKKRLNNNNIDICDTNSKCLTSNCLCLNTDNNNNNYKCDCPSYLNDCKEYTGNF